MGSAGSLPPIPRDHRVDRCIATFRLTPKILNKLWSVFCNVDHSLSGSITVEEFIKLIDMKRSSLTDSVDCFLSFHNVFIEDFKNMLHL